MKKEELKNSEDEKSPNVIDWKKYFTGIFTVMTIALIGGVWDFQNIKAEVKSMKKQDIKRDATMKAIGIIICGYAIKDKMENAEKVCKDVLE